MDHYSASFNSITEELDLVKEKFQVLMHRDNSKFEAVIKEFLVNKNRKRTTELKKILGETFTPAELKSLKWADKTLKAFKSDHIERYHENGYDHIGSPIITAEAPNTIKLYRWGFIPSFAKDRKEADDLQELTLNCISEEMFLRW